MYKLLPFPLTVLTRVYEIKLDPPLNKNFSPNYGFLPQKHTHQIDKKKWGTYPIKNIGYIPHQIPPHTLKPFIDFTCK
jgi:hypothetical protein